MSKVVRRVTDGDGGTMMEQSRAKPESPEQGGPDWRQRAVLGLGILAVIVASGVWVYKSVTAPREPANDSTASIQDLATPRDERIETGPKLTGDLHGAAPKFIPTKPRDSFLESFGEDDAGDDNDKAPAAANDRLQRHWQEIEKSQERLSVLEERLNAAHTSKDDKTLKELEIQASELSKQTDRDVKALEKALVRARRARPKDPVPQWLTGELLMFVRGEPGLILPYLKRAAEGGLDTARLWASMTHVQMAANLMDAAYQSALKALDRDDKDRYVWAAFTSAAFAVERFGEVAKRLTRAFAGRLPEWATGMLNDAVEMEAHWKIEEKLRQAEAKADDLPRVRLVIEHRRFARQNGAPSAKIESTGTEEVLLELFEDQAPATVANFLTLVSQKFYDGTKFFLCDPVLAAGGCPLTKNADPADDGSGGPGYTIPDEFGSSKARRHFRGSVAMVNSGDANSAGSSLFITLLPQPMMDGRYTVFARVLKGQEAVERITQGRTHPKVAEKGPTLPIIPGDLIVRAEVIRKRPHEYRVIKAGR
jgi:cyclophilin family peptidyl-prolyl cis-trans isomerase